MKIYHNPRCRKSREGIKYLESKKINFEVWSVDQLLKNNKIMPTDRIIIRERKDHLLGDDISMNLIIKDDIDFIDSNNYLMINRSTTTHFRSGTPVVSKGDCT